MFRIGEFSTIARVSKRLLHYYDEIGLLTPARVDPDTGYRFYSARQLPQLNRILALKEVGLSLEQIAEIVGGAITDDAVRAMLARRRAELEQALRDDLQRIQLLEARLSDASRGEAAPDVVMRAVPATPFLAVRAVVPSPAELMELIREVQRAAARLDSRSLGPLAGVVHTDGFTLTDNDVEVGYLLRREVRGPLPLAGGLALEARELPAVPMMATAVQAGGPELVFLALGRIGRWIEERGMRIAGPYREIGLALPGDPGFAELVVEVHIPVTPR